MEGGGGAKEEHLQGLEGLLAESQSQNLALTVLHVPSSLDSGMGLGNLI